MVSCTYGNTETIEQCAHIEVMNITYKERDDTPFLSSFTKDAHTRDCFQSLCGIFRQFMLISGNLIHANGRNIIESFRQSRSTDIVRSTGFELKRQFIEGSTFKRYMLYHLTATLIRR